VHSGLVLTNKESALANQRAVDPILGEKIPTALPERVFDKDMAVGHLLRDAARALTSLGAVEAEGALPHSLSRCWWLF